MIILGIDPGTASIGYGVLGVVLLKNKVKKVSYIDCGLITTKKETPFPVRLKQISSLFKKIIKRYRPDLVAIESVFFFKNLKTFIPVSRAEGVLILEAAKKNIPVVEFSPIQIKARVADYGRAEKKEVERRVKMALGLKEIPGPDDVADALAVALCGAISLGQ